MKKIYFAPETTIVIVETQQILAGSPLSLTSGGGTGQLQNETPDGGVLSRRSNDFWDDEEEDEY